YEILLQIFERFFAHTEESDAQLQVLADTTIALMVRVIKPLGDLITTLPVGPGQPGLNAGPSFELFYENDYLMPHREAAWALLAERLDQAAWLCEALQSGRGAAIAGSLDPVLVTMREIARTLAAHLPPGSAHAALAATPVPLGAAGLEPLLAPAAGRAGPAAGGGAGGRGGPAPGHRSGPRLARTVRRGVFDRDHGRGGPGLRPRAPGAGRPPAD